VKDARGVREMTPTEIGAVFIAGFMEIPVVPDLGTDVPAEGTGEISLPVDGEKPVDDAPKGGDVRPSETGTHVMIADGSAFPVLGR
jgi:hypothetical protein